MLPIVAAFRKDLISLVMRGGVVVTPEMLRGMQLVRDEVLKSSMVVSSEVTIFACFFYPIVSWLMELILFVTAGRERATSGKGTRRQKDNHHEVSSGKV